MISGFNADGPASPLRPEYADSQENIVELRKNLPTIEPVPGPESHCTAEINCGIPPLILA
jgi:hypothetical protein